MKNITFKNSFLEKIVNFDFDRYYTKKVRVFCHIFMWVLFTFLMYLNYNLGYKFDSQSSFLFSVRLAICNTVVFYILFYIIVPYTLKKNWVIFFIIFIVMLVQLWLVINYYYYYLLYLMDPNIDFGLLNDMIKKANQTKLIDIVSPENVMAHLFEVIMSLSPFLFVKIGFDLSRTYSASIKSFRQIEKLHYENLAMENKFLQTQLNPHFLFNTLNNLYALAITKSDLTPELILKLSNIMRYTLYEASVEVVSINKELDFIENYFDMEEIRYPEEYKIEKNIINKSNPGLKIAPLLTFVFIENAFKYGLKSDNPFLRMTIEINEKNVYFAVENDKTLLNDYIKDELSIGIENAKRRLNLLYTGKYSLLIKDHNNRFFVELKINLNENE